MKLVIGNRSYSSWSLRGWLTAKLSGLDFETLVVPLFDDDWPERRQGRDIAPSAGKVPILWVDDDIVVWDSQAILDWLADAAGADRFWPAEPAARAFARSMVGEMHSGYAALRRECGMNLRHRLSRTPPLSDEAWVDINRVTGLWAEAIGRFGQGGPFLFGDRFGAADAFFAPVVTRFITYAIPVDEAAAAYMQAVITHPWMQEWLAAAAEEPWVIERLEPKVA